MSATHHLARLLRKLRAMRRSCPKRDQLLMRVGAAKTEVGRAFGYVKIILVAFLAYCLTATLKHRLQAHAPGLTPRAVLEKLAAIQTLDVWLPTTDGRHLVMPRYTEPDTDLALFLHKLKLTLPNQPLPRLIGAPVVATTRLKM